MKQSFTLFSDSNWVREKRCNWWLHPVIENKRTWNMKNMKVTRISPSPSLLAPRTDTRSEMSHVFGSPDNIFWGVLSHHQRNLRPEHQQKRLVWFVQAEQLISTNSTQKQESDQATAARNERAVFAHNVLREFLDVFNMSWLSFEEKRNQSKL